MLEPEIADSIYEAAFIPDLWPKALQQLAQHSGSASGSIMVLTDPASRPHYRTAGVLEDTLRDFVGGDLWYQSRRGEMSFDEQLTIAASAGFFPSFDVIPNQDDPLNRLLRGVGIGAQQVTFVPQITGERVIFHFERLVELGRYDQRFVDLLDAHRPHLARASVIAARLRLERAQSAVDALQALGLPAAVMRAGGKVIATNPLIDAMTWLFLPAAFDRLLIRDATAAGLLEQAFATPENMAALRSIPVAPNRGNPGAVIHALPLVRSAHDIFANGDMLVIAAELGLQAAAPEAAMLTALFDLAPAEARLAAQLASGKTMAEAAAELGVTNSTVRTYLERIFMKTGVHRQTDLVSMLRGVSLVRSQS